MTKVTISILLSFIFLSASCFKSDDDLNSNDDCWTPPTEQPDHTGEGRGVSCFINDELWVAAKTNTNGIVGFVLGSPAVNIDYSTFEDWSNLWIQATREINSDCDTLRERLNLYINHPQEGNVSSTVSTISNFNNLLDNESNYQIDTLSPINVEITTFDLEDGGRFRGTFEFDAINEEINDTIRIRNGRFNGFL